MLSPVALQRNRSEVRRLSLQLQKMAALMPLFGLLQTNLEGLLNCSSTTGEVERWDLCLRPWPGMLPALALGHLTPLDCPRTEKP